MTKSHSLHRLAHSFCFIAPMLLGTAAMAETNPSYEEVERAVETIIQIEGDTDYGEYLSGECVACHAPAGTAKDSPIPSIAGWRREDLIRAMVEYRTGYRENPVMTTAMATKGDEEIASLAAWYSEQGQ
ncbi:hypothetical protein [Notoacmeibacter sp. MSK16QG-6]|uniref:c-type cytochrome n=1 Tax=Notoacmeibacter sp. MSK16QG-6 TaxID=2957982 RepID=UPI00209E622B|nr:hypothetical protein [Notoacmeibacter sp. MSK16QG-6]MCP1200819.1 hypothetical protein [Notoacmeibacter sp. MSK16QG-6]